MFFFFFHSTCYYKKPHPITVHNLLYLQAVILGYSILNNFPISMPPVKVQKKTFRHETSNKVVFYSVASQNLNYFSLTLLK